MAINFPDSPTTGQEFTAAGLTWVFQGTPGKWFSKAVPGSGGGGTTVTIQDTPPTSPAPVAGNLWYESDTGRLYIYYDGFWVEIGHPTTPPPVPGGAPRNRIINGGFDVWQRGGSGFTGAYTADQWFALSNTSTQTVTRQPHVLGSIPGYEPTYFLRDVVVAGATTAGAVAFLDQRIEGVRTLAGQQVTVSFWAKADAAKSVFVELAQNFGGGGSPSAGTLIQVNKFTLGTTWQRFTATVTIPSIAGKTLGTDGRDALELLFWFSAGSDYNARCMNLGQQSGTFDIWGVQVEPGAIANPFEVRTYDDVLRACQRYLRVYGGPTYANVGWGSIISSTVAIIAVNTAVMRALPAISNVGTWYIADGASAYVASTWFVDANASTGDLTILNVTFSGSATPFRPAYLYANNQAASRLLLSAEL